MNTSSKNQKESPLTNTYLLILLVFCVIVLLILSYSVKQNISFVKALKDIEFALRSPDFFSSSLGTISGININTHMYLTILLTLGLSVLLKFVLSTFKIKNFSLKSGQSIVVISLTICGLTFLAQSFSQTYQFSKVYKYILNKTPHKFYLQYHRYSYVHANVFKKAVSGQHRCLLQTDLNLQGPSEMYIHRQLSYHLFPTIDIRETDRTKPVDCIIYFNKRDIKEKIPKNYKLLGWVDKYSAIAIKETP